MKQLFFGLMLLLPIVGLTQSTANPDTVCYQNSGSIYSVVNTPGFDFSWSVQAPGILENGQGSNEINVDWSGAEPGLISDAITVFAIDQDGCHSDTLTLDVLVYNISFALDEIGPLCDNDPCTDLTASPEGGIWSGSGVSNNQFCPEVSGVGTFELTYTYVDAGCTFTSVLSVTVDEVVSATITPVDAICENESVTMQASEPGGSWTATCGNCINPQTGLFSGASSGPGSFTISYGFNSSCSAVATTVIDVAPSVDASINAVPTLCETAESFTISASDQGGVWSAECDNCLTAGGTFNPQVSGAGTYTVTYEIEGFCSDIDLVDVVVLAQTNADFELLNPLCLDAGVYTPIPNQVGGLWSASCGGCINENTGEIDLVMAGEGEIVVTYTFEGLCGSESIEVAISIPCTIELPNIFSPNNDGVNDVLRFENLEFFPGSKLTVTNRWGQVVYENNEYNRMNNWRGDELPEGTYFFTLSMRNGDTYNGPITLVR